MICTSEEEEVALKAVLALMKNLAQRVKEITFLSNIEGAEIGSVLAAAWCCFVLALPGNYLHSSPRLEVLAHFAPEWLWATALHILGAFQTVTLLFGGFPSSLMKTQKDILHWHTARMIGLLAGTVIWGFLGLLMTIGSPTLVAGMFIIASGGCSYGYWRMYYTVSLDREVAAKIALGKTIDSVPPLTRTAGAQQKG